ncbi:uncharacterized protein METZ01_LOCUS366275, partial [marine metagenome]
HGAGGFGEVEVLAGDEFATAGAGHHDGQRAVLVRGAITQAGAVSKNRVVQERAAVGFLDHGHLLHEISKLRDVKAVHLEQVVDELTLVVRHAMVAARFVEKALVEIRRGPRVRGRQQQNQNANPKSHPAHRGITRDSLQLLLGLASHTPPTARL